MNQLQSYPVFYWMMNDMDKYGYNCLKYQLSNATKNQRNKRLTNFNEAIESIKLFAIRGDKDDKIRSLVSGICWLPEGIAINTHQLKALLGKCKSSINGSLQKMGFAQNLTRAESIQALTNFFPFFKDNTAELRKWSIRHYPSTESTIYSPPVINGEKIIHEKPAVEISVQQVDFDESNSELASDDYNIFEPINQFTEADWVEDTDSLWTI